METGDKPKLILFDVNETLLDMSPIKKAINTHFDRESAAKEWFLYLLQFSLVEMVTDNYHNFSEIGDVALDMLAQSLEKKIPQEKKEEILGLMAKLEAHDDVKEGLRMLKNAGFRLATLTNSAQKVADKQLVHAGIDHYFEASMSVDGMKMFKPKLNTYYQALKKLDVAAEDVLFVAAHGWDTTGAMRAGIKTAFIARPEKVLYPLAPAPAYTGKTLIDIAKQLV